METTGASRGRTARPGQPQRERAPEPFWSHENPRARRYAEWHVAQHAMPPTWRAVLRALVLYQDARLAEPCRASPEALARRTSLSPRTVRAVLRAARRAGLVWAGGGVAWVTVPPEVVDESARELRRLWAHARWLRERWWFRHVPGRPPWTRAEDALLRVRQPELSVDLEPRDEELGEEWAGRCGAAEDATRAAFVNRFAWMRELVEWGNFARGRVRRNGAALVKAVAFALELLMDTQGRPFRWTTLAEVARWAGYRKLERVRAALRVLERAGWLGVQRQRGRGGGLLLWLTVPPLVRERWARAAEAAEAAAEGQAMGGQRR